MKHPTVLLAVLLTAAPAVAATPPPAEALRALQAQTGGAPIDGVERVENERSPMGHYWEGEWTQPDGRLGEARVTPDGALLLRETHIAADALPMSLKHLVAGTPDAEVERVEMLAYEITTVRDGVEHEVLVLPDGQRISWDWLTGGTPPTGAAAGGHEHADGAGDDGGDGDADGDGDEPTPVAVGDLPAAVRDRVFAMFPGATLTEARAESVTGDDDEDLPGFELQVVDGEHTYEVEFTAAGLLVGVELDDD